MSNIPTPWKRYVDKTMYKSIQYFRLYMSTKFGKGRIKNYDVVHSTWVPSSDEPVMETFLNSIVSYTDECTLIPFEEDDDGFVTYEKTEIGAEDEIKVRKIISAMPYSKCFSISEVKDGIVVMRRMVPSFCSVCEKVHEHENPFAYVSMSGNVFFSCRRNNKSSLIGNINDEVVTCTEVQQKRTVTCGFFDKEEKKGEKSPTSITCSFSPVCSQTSDSLSEKSLPGSPLSFGSLGVLSVKSQVQSEQLDKTVIPKKQLSYRIQRLKQKTMEERLSSISINEELDCDFYSKSISVDTLTENHRIQRRKMRLSD